MNVFLSDCVMCIIYRLFVSRLAPYTLPLPSPLSQGADVMNALDVMENGGVFGELQFGAGDGYLQYYVYNWRCPQMPASKVGLVLL